MKSVGKLNANEFTTAMCNFLFGRLIQREGEATEVRNDPFLWEELTVQKGKIML